MSKTKQLIKILIGAAWIDGTIQPAERTYLHNMVNEKNLGDDPEIKALLSEARPIQATECYQLLEEYLGNNPSETDYQNLLEAISALIYSDGEVEIEEAKLLTRLQSNAPTNGNSTTIFNKLLKGIQTIYRKAITEEN